MAVQHAAFGRDLGADAEDYHSQHCSHPKQILSSVKRIPVAGHSHYAKKIGLDDKVPDLFFQVAMNYHDGICTCAGADVLHARCLTH